MRGSRCKDSLLLKSVESGKIIKNPQEGLKLADVSFAMKTMARDEPRCLVTQQSSLMSDDALQTTSVSSVFGPVRLKCDI